MKERLEDAPDIDQRAFIATVHSFCMEVLENRGKSIGFTGPLNIMESYRDRLEIFGEAVRQDPALAELLAREGNQKSQNQALGRWLSMISDHKAALRSADLVENSEEQALYMAYESALQGTSAVDFDDLLLLTYRIFEESPKIAAFYRRQYRYIFVDEAQDINEAQYRLLCALCGNEHRNVMLVGDPKQAIYVWNGANPKYLDLFTEDFRAEVVSLNENFRSSRAVVAAAKALNPDYAVEGQLPIEGHVELVACDDEEAEAAYVCDTLERLIQEGHEDVEGGIALEDCAILGRNRYVFQAVESALRERGHSHHKKLATGTFQSESELVQAFELGLRVVANPHDRLHIGRLAKLWRVAGDANSLRQAAKDQPDSGKHMLRVIAAEASEEVCRPVLTAIDALGLDSETVRFGAALNLLHQQTETLPDDSRALAQQDLRSWRRHWDQFVRAHEGGAASLRLFLSQLALGSTEQPKGEGAALLTIHSAKGMEFDVVFVLGMCAGVFPDYRARGEAMEEEDRNAFVAVTRARRLLFMSYPRVKVMPWGDQKAQRPSKYYVALQREA